MSTLYPMDFHRRVDRRWAERMALAAADAHGSMAHARLTGQRRNEIRHAGEGLETRYFNLMPPKDRSAAGGWLQPTKADLAQFPLTSNHPPSFRGARNDDRESGANRPANTLDYQLRRFREVAFTAGWTALAVLLPELVSLASRLDCGQGPRGQEG